VDRIFSEPTATSEKLTRRVTEYSIKAVQIEGKYRESFGLPLTKCAVVRHKGVGRFVARILRNSLEEFFPLGYFEFRI
jgi:hypothetical protein